jgi:hypothetical protein
MVHAPAELQWIGLSASARGTAVSRSQYLLPGDPQSAVHRCELVIEDTTPSHLHEERIAPACTNTRIDT